jgi:hypothetical protein
MTLNASGPLSFGGAVTGQSINLELGVSATALASINSTSFRTLAGVASGQISVSNFYGKSNARGWVAIFGNYASSGTEMIGGGITTDSSGNFVITGTFSSNVYGIAKISTTPAVVSQNSYSQFSVYQTSIGQAGTAQPLIDSSGNIWLTSASTSSGQNFLTKYTSALAVDNTINNVSMSNGNSVIQAKSTASNVSDASGNIYVTYCNNFDAGCCNTADISFAAKYTPSTNTVVWRKQLYNDGLIVQDQAIDSSGNLWIVGIGSGDQLIKIVTSTGTKTDQRFPNSRPYAVAVDSSGNKYVTNASKITSTYFNLMKINSAGSIVWARKIFSGYGGGTKKVIVGGDGYIYMVGNMAVNNVPDRRGFIVKYDSSGTIQWQRNYYNASPYSSVATSVGLMGCIYTATGLAIVGQIPKSTTNTSSVCTIALLPLDGSGTGSYTVNGSNITYAAATYTESADTDATITASAYGEATASASSSYTNSATAISYSIYSASV